MIFNMTGGGGKGEVPVNPRYTGAINVVYLSEDGLSGYAEFTTSGTLTFIGGAPDIRFDLFCVGGGGSGNGEDYDNAKSGSGGGSGYTTTVEGAELPQTIDITIGAGGTGVRGRQLGNAGGSTSIGELCVAAGGKPGATLVNGGNGGSGGGGAGGTNSAGGSGGSNGDNGNSGGAGIGGTGQGTPTTDLLGRIHAGGGGGSARGGTAPNGGAGGASDFTAGKGGDAPTYSADYDGYRGYGGGGYGGGGAGGNYTYGYTSKYSGSGGQGFAMIAWGDYRKLYWGVDEEKPIEGYTRLEYIAADGTQYIDTGFTPNYNTRVIAEAVWAPAESGSTFLFGAAAGSTSNAFEFGGNSAKYRMLYNATEKYFTSTEFDQPMQVDMYKGTAQINDAEYASIAYASFSSGYPLFLCASNRAGSAYGVHTATIYRCKVYDNGTLVRHFVPVQSENGEVGLYDLVNSVFYANAGTGASTAGPTR